MGCGRKLQTAFSHHTSIAYYFNVNVFLNNIPMGPVDHNHELISPLEFPISKCFSHIKYPCFRLFPLGIAQVSQHKSLSSFTFLGYPGDILIVPQCSS